MKTKSYRILAKNRLMDNDTRVTGLNNNDLIIGPSGAGKTRGYVKPNIMQCNESMIIADTKGSLIDEVGPLLRQNGYRVLLLNFKDLNGSSCGYNPLDYVRFDRRRGKYREQDIITIAGALVPQDNYCHDPFWDNAAKMYLTSILAYILECLPKQEHSLAYAIEMINQMYCGNYKHLMNELKAVHPDSYAVQTYRLFENNGTAEKMDASIIGILAEKLNGLNFEGAIRMYTRKNRVDFRTLGREKTALFLTISDTDRSMDRLVSLFYTQALHQLCESADAEPGRALPVPVRFILDDFATNACIPDFQNIISVIRSREIYVSIILQSITQLNAIYGGPNAGTIINNCDNCLYLGGQDVSTARFMSTKANKTVDTILNMPLSDAWLFTRGQPPRKAEKFDIRQHARYHLLPEAKQTPAKEITTPPGRSEPVSRLQKQTGAVK